MTQHTVTVTEDSYKQIAISADKLADALRGAADWLDEGEKRLGEVFFVGGMHFELLDDGSEPWQVSLFVHEYEYDEAFGDDEDDE